MTEPFTPPFTPPFPKPLKSKAGLLRRFLIGRSSWIHTLFEKSYTLKLGRTRLPRLTFFVVGEPSLVAEVMDDPQRIFPKHRLLNDMLDPLLGRSVFSVNGKEWEDQRAMINPAFQHTNLKRAFPAMAAAGADLIAMLRARAAAGPIDIDPLMTHVAADIIFRTLFTMRLTEAESHRVYEAFNRYQAVAQPSTVLGLYGLPRGFYRRRMARAAADVHALFAPILQARLDDEGAEHADILQALIAARHPDTGAAFTYAQLIDQLSIIFLAGHETSASALGWTLYCLGQCPGLQETLLAEINTATDGAALTFEHLKSLGGVRNLFREGLRLYPPVSFLPREATCPMERRGKQINPGDMLVVSPWLIQRNPEHWKCPHAFDPDRFTRAEEMQAGKQAWLPFGRGPRICIGAGFAQQEGVLILAEIIRAFRLSAAPGHTPELVNRLTLRPKNGIPLLLTPREG